MGKLSELWQMIKDMDEDDPRVPEVQQEINKVEKWMIEKGYKKDGVTQWGKTISINPNIYPHHTGYVKLEDVDLIGELNGLHINYDRDGNIHHCTNCK